jgi:hypothetical protein
MLGSRPVVPTLLCGRYKAEIVGAVIPDVCPTGAIVFWVAFISCRLHRRLMSRSTNKNEIFPPTHHALFEIFIVSEKAPF